MRNAVVVDLAPHPAVQYAVIWRGQLLPMRFGEEGEAIAHLSGLIEKHGSHKLKSADPRPEGAEEHGWPEISRADSGTV